MYINKKHPLVYIFYSLIGAIILPLMYHISLQNKYKISSLLPTIPLLGLFGLFIIIKNNGNYNKYIKLHIKFLLITTIFYIFILCFIYLNYSIYTSLFISSLLWLLINCYNLFLL